MESEGKLDSLPITVLASCSTVWLGESGESPRSWGPARRGLFARLMLHLMGR